MVFDNKSKSALNKLIVLYILDKIEISITNAQITNIILENNIINYFSLQESIAELEKSDLIKLEENQGQHTYQISEAGQRTVALFMNKIPKSNKTLINDYILKNKDRIKKESEIFADFTKNNENEYVVNLKVVENDIILIDLKLNVVSAKQARLICDKWNSSSSKIYGQIMDSLIN
jgi:predicted transcriptional regulator